MGILSALVMLAMAFTEPDEQPELELIRTTVYYAPEWAKTATGTTVRYGIVAYKPEYFGKTCILYTQDMEYIGIFECQDTGGKMIRTGQRLDVYTGADIQSCYDWADEYGAYCYMQWIDSEG